MRPSLEPGRADDAEGRPGGPRAPGIAAVSLSVGLALCGWALLVARETRAWISRAVPAEGTVVALWRDGDGTSFPVVRFETAAGRAVTFRGALGSSPPAHAVGERVPVLYDPVRPDDARVATRKALWFFPVVAGGLGVLLCGLSAGALVRRRRRTPPAAPPASPRGRSDRGLARRR